MSEPLIMQMLRAAFRERAGWEPSDAPAITTECPPLSRIGAALRQGWTAEEHKHAASCEYCRRTVARFWDHRCPPVAELARFQQDPQKYAFRQAIEMHVGGSSCRCAAVVEAMTAGLAAVRVVLRGATALLEPLNDIFGRSPVFDLAPVVLRGASGESSSLEGANTTSPEERLSWTLNLKPQPEIMIALEDHPAGSPFPGILVVSDSEQAARSEAIEADESSAFEGRMHGFARLRNIGPDDVIFLSPAGKPE